MSEPDALSVGAGVDRRVDLVIVVDSTSLAAAPDDPVAGPDARNCETEADDPPDEEAADGATREALDDLAGELGLDDAEAVEPEPSTIAVALGAMTQPHRRLTVFGLKAEQCRYPVSSEERFENERCREEHLFCGEPIASGSPSYCLAHHRLTHAAPKSRHALRSEFIARKLSRLAIVAALKRE